MKTLSVYLVLAASVGAVEASRQSLFQQPLAFFNRFSGWEGEEYEEEEDDGGMRLGSVALKALVGAGVAAASGAGISFARRAIKSKQQQQPSSRFVNNNKRSSASLSPASEMTTTVKGGAKGEAKVGGTATTAPPPPAAAAAAAAAAGATAGGEEEEPEEIFDIESVVELDEDKLSSKQKDHPYAKLLGPKLVHYDKKKGKLIEVPTADVLDGKVTSLFFHAQQVEQMLEKMKAGKVLPGLKEVYAEQIVQKNNFEIVFLSLPDGQEGRFQSYLKDMPWYAVPFNSTERIRDAYKAFSVQNLPAAVIMDEEAKLINDKGFTYMLIDKEGFPWKPKTLTEMMGTKFLNNKKETIPAAEVAKKKVLGLYFSANWCKPCQEFTPKLAELYTKLRAEGKDFEVVFVSMDESEEKFTEYFKEMPWLSLPYEDKTTRSLLMTELEVRGLPSLVILDEDRKVITTKGRDFALKDPEGEKFPWHPQPLNEISYSFDGIAQKPSVVVFMEGVTGDVQEKIVKELQAVAEDFTEKNKANPEDEAHRFNFFYAKDISTFSKALRSIVGLEQLSPKDKFLKAKAEATKPRLVLLDIAKEVCHVSSGDITLNEAAVRQVLEDRVAGSLEMTSFQQPEPAEEGVEGPAGAAAGAK